MSTLVSIEDIKYVAQLAKIELSEAELDGYVRDFDVILHRMDEIFDIDIADNGGEALPCECGTEAQYTLREDKVANGIDKDELLRAAPSVKDGLLAVPNSLAKHAKNDTTAGGQ